jgi:hypothetical protein
MDLLIDPYRVTAASEPSLAVSIVASDGKNSDELSTGYEAIVKVGAEVWWNSNMGALGLKSLITDPFVDGGYPGPTNYTTLPNAFSAYSMVYDGADVWTYSSPVPSGPTVSRINGATKAVTVYTGAQQDTTFYVDNSNNLWRSLYIVNPSGPGMILSANLEQVNKASPVGANIGVRTFTYGPLEVVFVGSDCFASVSGNAPFGLPNLEKVDNSNVRTIIDLSAHMTGRPNNFVVAPDRGSIFLWGAGSAGKLVEVDTATGAIVKATTPVPGVVVPNGEMVYDQPNGVLIFSHRVAGVTTVYAVAAATGLVVAQHTVTIPFFTGFNYGVSGWTALHLAAGQVLATAQIAPSNVDPIYYTETVIVRITYTP